MHISHESLNDAELVIKVQVTEADYKETLIPRLQQHRKEAHIKGFRKGKVPISVIDRLYGAAVRVEVVEEVVRRGISDYLKANNGLFMGGVTLMTEEAMPDWKVDKEFVFKYSIGKRPQFDCTLPEDMKLPRYHVAHIDEEVIEKELREFREAFGESEEVVDGSTQDCHLHGGLHCSSEGYYGRFEFRIQDLPSTLMDRFVGLKVGDSVILDFEQEVKPYKVLTKNIGSSMLDILHTIGGPVTFIVKGVERIILAPVDQRLFENMWNEAWVAEDGISLEQQFKDRLRKDLMEFCKDLAQVILEKELKDALLKHFQIPISKDWLEKWLKVRMPRWQHEINPDKYEKKRVDELKWSLLEEKLAQVHALEPTQEEVIQNLTRVYNIPEEQVQASIDNMSADELDRRKEKIAAVIRQKSVLKFLKEKVTLQEEVVSYSMLNDIKQRYES